MTVLCNNVLKIAVEMENVITKLEIANVSLISLGMIVPYHSYNVQTIAPTWEYVTLARENVIV
jgi:hypothetical protein